MLAWLALFQYWVMAALGSRFWFEFTAYLYSVCHFCATQMLGIAWLCSNTVYYKKENTPKLDFFFWASCWISVQNLYVILIERSRLSVWWLHLPVPETNPNPIQIDIDTGLSATQHKNHNLRWCFAPWHDFLSSLTVRFFINEYAGCSNYLSKLVMGQGKETAIFSKKWVEMMKWTLLSKFFRVRFCVKIFSKTHD